MTHDWQQYTPKQVRTDKIGGSRLVLAFAKDYKNYFNQELTCINCESSFKNEFLKYIRTMSKEAKNDYELKPKYNGLPLGFGLRGRVYNGKITKKQADHLLKNHPKGEDLFKVLPEDSSVEMSKKEVIALLTKKGIDFDPKAKKDDLLEILNK